MLTIGLVGCGTIGSRLALEIESKFRGVARLIGLYDHHPKAAQLLIHRLRRKVPVLPPKKLISRSDLLIEAASAQAVGELLPHVIAMKKSALLMSTGGLLNHRRLLSRAVALHIPIYLPSGALVGLDGIKGAACAPVHSVTLTTRKHPTAFVGAPEVTRRKIQLHRIWKPRLLFQGSALQAVRAFPQNINVAATVALAGIGPTRTRVRVIADPTLRANVHEVETVGDFGRMITRTENRPSQENPKTSTLAVLSAIATLRQILQPLRIGT